MLLTSRPTVDVWLVTVPVPVADCASMFAVCVGQTNGASCFSYLVVVYAQDFAASNITAAYACGSMRTNEALLLRVLLCLLAKTMLLLHSLQVDVV